MPEARQQRSCAGRVKDNVIVALVYSCRNGSHCQDHYHVPSGGTRGITVSAALDHLDSPSPRAQIVLYTAAKNAGGRNDARNGN